MKHVSAGEPKASVEVVTTVRVSKLPVGRYRAALRRFLLDRSGQDFIEYALLAAFVATCAATISPQVASGAGVMFSRVTSVITVAGS